MHCYDLMLRVPRGGRRADLIVLWISGGNHHPLIDFGVERHTLANQRYHLGISLFISRVFFVEGAAQPRRVQAILRIQRSAIDLCPDWRFIPTQ
jgi:hypothetical protein